MSLSEEDHGPQGNQEAALLAEIDRLRARVDEESALMRRIMRGDHGLCVVTANGWKVTQLFGNAHAVEAYLRNRDEMPDKYGNTENDPMRYCCFPDCGCDGARLCDAREGPNVCASVLNLEKGAIRG